MTFKPSDFAVCETCGTQFDVPLSQHPETCRICDDPRQYVPASGQSWTSLKKESEYQKNIFETDPHDSRIVSISTKPLTPAELPPGLADATTTRKQLGIGQRALFLQTAKGNVLWDCIALLDQATVDFINSKGGLKAIIISHPHFYTSHIEWASVFQCPVYMSAADEEWLNRADKDGCRRLVSGVTEIPEVECEVRHIQAGGHFDGSAFLLWEKKLFIADTMMSVPSGFDNAHRLPNQASYSFMWSYPNLIPLPPSKIHGIWKALKPFEFTSSYGGFPGQYLSRPDLKAQVLASMKLFLKTGGHEHAAVFNETV